MAVILAADEDLEYAQKLQECLHVFTKDKYFPVRVCNAQRTGEWEHLEKGIEDGWLCIVLLTHNLVSDRNLVLNLMSLVRRCMHHSNGFGNFFIPVYFERSKKDRHYLPLFFQGWKGLYWFSLKKQLYSIVQNKINDK